MMMTYTLLPDGSFKGEINPASGCRNRANSLC
jgi:hypothetical protein